MQYRKIGLASDHAGYKVKEELMHWLISKGYNVVDFGTNNEESTDYADYGHKLADAVESRNVDIGISVCGSGNGINMTVNKHQGIRAALCWNKEISRLARAHNDANICTLPGRFVSVNEALEIVETFLNTSFEGGRHQRRINKIPLTK